MHSTMARPRRDRRGRGELLIVLGMTGLIISGLSYVALRFYFRTAGIRTGVHFLGYDLSGLKVNDAASRIEAIVDYVYSEPAYLKFEGHLWMLRYKKHFRLESNSTKIALGATRVGERRSVYQQLFDWATLGYPKIELSDPRQVDQPFVAVLDRKFTQSNVGARLAWLAADKIHARPLPDGKVELSNESKTSSLDVILDALETSFKQHPLVERRVVEVSGEPQAVSRRVVELFDPKHGFTVVLQQKTSVVESADPATFDNIVLACQKINGVMVNPGEVFSFNRVVGERSARRGFHAAAGGRAIGIGVGQVSSTMYEPFLRVGCKVLERHRHSIWYPELRFSSPGLDAAVTDAGWDLRVQNDAPLPLLLVAGLQGAKLTFEIRSVQEPPYKIELHTGKVGRVPFRTDWVPDPTIARGLPPRTEVAGCDGYRVKVYRTWLTREEGRKEREERISDDEYQARNAVVRVPRGFVAPSERSEPDSRAPEARPDAPGGRGGASGAVPEAKPSRAAPTPTPPAAGRSDPEDDAGADAGADMDAVTDTASDGEAADPRPRERRPRERPESGPEGPAGGLRPPSGPGGDGDPEPDRDAEAGEQ
jgi:hypothetical protein